MQGIRWYDVVVTGKEAHAGPTPMADRQDPVKGLTAVMQGIYDLADRFSPEGRATIGDITVEPGVINTVPGRATLKVDLRHPQADLLFHMDRYLHDLVEDVNHMPGLEAEFHEIWHSAPAAFDQGCISSVRKAAQIIGESSMDIVSGAGHDAVYVSHVAPTGMIFIPCKGGLSHNEAESIKMEDAAAGANVLLQAVLDQAFT